jgi:hypothetical protein
LYDAVQDGYSKITIHTSDTDVVVLAICFSQQIHGLEELRVEIGSGKLFGKSLVTELEQ